MAGSKSIRKGEKYMSENQGKLYLCATPIGNLEDITMRVLRVLQEVDLIAAEDTRNSIRLLNHFDIHTPLTSYHEYNKIEKAYVLIEEMKKGKDIALITDAGTPGISDPGEDLVRLCYENGVEVTSLPGACACVTALTLSGLSTRRFCFEAFLPSDKKEKQEVPACWVSVKQFSKNDTATACQDWLRSTRLGRGSIKSHVRTVKVLGMGLFAFQERIHLWKGVTH